MADVFMPDGGVTATMTVMIILTRETVVSLKHLSFASYDTSHKI